MKKILYFIVVFAAMLAAFALTACGKKDSGTESGITDIAAEIPYVSNFTCEYYTPDGQKIENKNVFEPGDEIRVKINFTLLPDAYANGKSKFTVKITLSADLGGKIVSANSSDTSDKDLTATFAADDKNSKNGAIETQINVYFGSGSVKIAYAYDDEEYTEVSKFSVYSDKVMRYTYDDDTGGYIISKDPDNGTWINDIDKVSLPDSFNGKPVTVLGENLFEKCTNLTSVEFPNNLIRIENGVFFGCHNLKSITLPDTVTTIGRNVFMQCISLRNVTIPDGITSIGSNTFFNCGIRKYNEYENAWYLGNERNPYVVLIAAKSDATSVEINKSTKVIYAGAFENRSVLTSVSIPDGVRCIGDDAFSYCDNLQYNEYKNAYYLGNEKNPYIIFIKPINNDVTSVDINGATKFIHSTAFLGCDSLTSITIPDSVTSVGWGAFYDCDNLKTVNITDLASWCNIDFVSGSPMGYAAELRLNGELLQNFVIPDGITKIKDYSFFGCNSLISITIPDSVTSIGKYAFYGCSSLTSITIPDNITSIREYTFYGCSGLTSIAIPSGVTSIGKNAFDECSGLEGVYITDLTAWCNIEFVNDGDEQNLKTLTWYSNPLTYADKLYLNGSLITDLVIPDGMTEIKNGIFCGCFSLESLTIPDSVTSIGRGAFLGCNGLRYVTIPSSVTYIAKGAFSVNCTAYITFDGTNAEWRKIASDAGYQHNQYNATVKCTDGEMKFWFYDR